MNNLKAVTTPGITFNIVFKPATGLPGIWKTVMNHDCSIVIEHLEAVVYVPANILRVVMTINKNNVESFFITTEEVVAGHFAGNIVTNPDRVYGNLFIAFDLPEIAAVRHAYLQVRSVIKVINDIVNDVSS